MKHLFLLLTLLSFSLTALAQQKVTGKVKDSSGEPVIGASVVVKGNNTMGTITDFDGNFMLDVPTKSVLVISYIGYVTQEVPTAGKKSLEIILKEDTKTLDEVVVIGYGTQRKGDVTSSVASGKSDKEEKDQDSEKVRAHMGELKDQFGKSHKLEDYKGKVIFLNFWATWCGPCRSEMPEIQKLYEEYTAMGNDSEVVILGVAGPGIGQEGTVSDITKFMEENGYTYPVLMDETGELFEWYGISAFPTTYMIDRDGNLYGYVTGQLTEDIMRSIIKQTLEGKAP